VKIALALGGAAGVFDEAKEARALLGRDFDMVGACNDVGARVEYLTHWCTLHPDKFPGWMSEREKNGFGGGYSAWCHKHSQRMRFRICHDWGGSSGLLVVKVLLEEGADRVICAGTPMTNTPWFHKKAPWGFADHHYRAWQKHLSEIRERVRSMSGRTRELLGAPTREWLGLPELVTERGDERSYTTARGDSLSSLCAPAT
jgi:hypothetical protein